MFGADSEVLQRFLESKKLPYCSRSAASLRTRSSTDSLSAPCTESHKSAQTWSPKTWQFRKQSGLYLRDVIAVSESCLPVLKRHLSVFAASMCDEWALLNLSVGGHQSASPGSGWRLHKKVHLPGLQKSNVNGGYFILKGKSLALILIDFSALTGYLRLTFYLIKCKRLRTTLQ